MDLIDFRLVRRPRTAPGDRSTIARLDGELTKQVAALADDEATRERARHAARDWVAANAIPWSSSPTVTGREGLEDRALELIAATDDWLVARGDRPPDKALADHRDAGFAGMDAADRTAGLAAARRTLADAITAHLLLERDRTALARLCRRLLVADLLRDDLLPDADLQASTGDTAAWDWLHRRTVVTDAAVVAMSAAGGPCVRLVRDAAVADLFVVRSEWSCFQAGEVASITNTLANSLFEVERTVTREEETVDTTLTERTEATERAEEERLQTELTREVERAVELQADVSGTVDVSGKYGFTEFGVSAAASASASVSENVRQAGKIARDLVSRAVAKVESRVREERVRRTLRRTEDRTKHVIDNQGGGHTNGIYRWVDRIDRYQVFRYPDRLLLELQLPEPAEYLRWRMAEARRRDDLAVGPPPPFDVVADQIDPGTYADLALTYRAANLPPPPDDAVSVTQLVKAVHAGEPVQNADTQWDYPKLEGTATVTVPTGYVAEDVLFDGAALPYRANWRVEYRTNDPVRGVDDVEGFHRITMSVAAGPQAITDGGGGTFEQGRFTVQIDSERGSGDRADRRFGDAVFTFPQRHLITLNPPARDQVMVGFVAGGAASAVVSFLVRCRRTDSAYAEWQHTVYDALLDAWRGWDQEWRTSQLQQLATGGPGGWDVTSPARNREIVRDELKRQAIAWLLDEQAFGGRDAMVDRSAADTWDLVDLARARDVAATVQFLEQAFEWGNLTYVCYPYYWARASRWDELTGIEAADPQLAQFLRAGSVRLVVPARPGMEESVGHWLAYCEPFLGGPLPTPDAPDYLSIAEEIRELTGPVGGGEPGACWEVRLGTPLLWLDPMGALPTNTRRQLGRDPNPPAEPLCG